MNEVVVGGTRMPDRDAEPIEAHDVTEALALLRDMATLANADLADCLPGCRHCFAKTHIERGALVLVGLVAELYEAAEFPCEHYHEAPGDCAACVGEGRMERALRACDDALVAWAEGVQK